MKETVSTPNSFSFNQCSPGLCVLLKSCDSLVPLTSGTQVKVMLNVDDADDKDDNHLGLPGPGQQTRAQEVRQHHTWRGVRVGEHTSIFQSKSFLIKPSFILTPCDHY